MKKLSFLFDQIDNQREKNQQQKNNIFIKITQISLKKQTFNSTQKNLKLI